MEIFKNLNTGFRMKTIFAMFMVLVISITLNAQPYRVGTTSANFLEIGFGAEGNSMGDAYTSLANNISASYWNPAGLASMNNHEAMFSYQPWLGDIKVSYAAIGVVLPIGTIATSITSMNYGEMVVTNMFNQEGTGEMFNAADLSIGLSYARKLADWFAFGATFKYISQTIWHSSASAMAVDLGVKINTGFFSPTGEVEQGMDIGMSISNYGTPMKFDGIDLVFPIDIAPNEAGNYAGTNGQFKMQEWELPLIFRVGFAVHPIYTAYHKLSLAVDALHPNNNSEYVNVGAQYTLSVPTFGDVFIRGGYKGLFMYRSDYGLSFGFGVDVFALYNKGIKINYAFREHMVLGNTHSYEVTLRF